MRYSRNDIPEIADEYVLGLLDEQEQAEVETEMDRDADLRVAIAASRDRFLALDTQIEPAAVSATLWDAIAVSLPPSPAIPLGSPLAAVSTEVPLATNDNRPYGGWRTTALAGIAASLLLAIGLAFSLMRTVEPLVIAVLVNETGDVQAVVEDFGNENASIRLLSDFSVPADKTIQVWTLPSREMGPISLGLLSGSRSTQLHGPELPRPKDAQLYEITLEQAGGSPTGRPTGPILAKGLAKLPR